MLIKISCRKSDEIVRNASHVSDESMNDSDEAALGYSTDYNWRDSLPESAMARPLST